MARGQEKEWPYCVPLQGTCLVYDVGRYLGESVRTALLNFIVRAEEGARLTLQRSRDGFTVQVTGAVHRGEAEPLSLTEARALRERLDLLNGGERQQ
ncbi:MAG: hypothetical protein HYY00_04080 [Chloroflexi bacterium]|nr:hypothetical protein [Chloroflexota bacterium]